jgi:hypothetical protein
MSSMVGEELGNGTVLAVARLDGILPKVATLDQLTGKAFLESALVRIGIF